MWVLQKEQQHIIPVFGERQIMLFTSMLRGYDGRQIL